MRFRFRKRLVFLIIIIMFIKVTIGNDSSLKYKTQNLKCDEDMKIVLPRMEFV